MGNRQGQRTDLRHVENFPQVSDDSTVEELPQNFEEVKGKKSLEIAAQKAGFNNKETYRQAKSVVDHGVPGQKVQRLHFGLMS